MSSPDVIHDLTTLSTDQTELASKIFVGKPREYSNGKGGKSVSIGFGSAEKVTFFQTPRMYSPFGLDKSKQDSGFESMNLVLNVRDEAKGSAELVALCQAMSHSVVKAAFDNQLDFFGTPVKDYKSIDVIKDRFHPILKTHEVYAPQLKLKIDESSTRFFDKTAGKEPIRMDDCIVPEKTTCRAIVRFGPVWIMSTQKFGITVKADQVLIIAAGVSMKRGPNFDKIMVKDDSDEEAPIGDVKDEAVAPADDEAY